MRGVKDRNWEWLHIPICIFGRIQGVMEENCTAGNGLFLLLNQSLILDAEFCKWFGFWQSCRHTISHHNCKKPMDRVFKLLWNNNNLKLHLNVAHIIHISITILLLIFFTERNRTYLPLAEVFSFLPSVHLLLFLRFLQHFYISPPVLQVLKPRRPMICLSSHMQGRFNVTLTFP